MNHYEKPHFTGSLKEDADLFVSRLISTEDEGIFLQRLPHEPELVTALRETVREIGGINEETNQLIVGVLGHTWMND